MLGRDPRRICCIEVEQLVAKYGQSEMVVCLGRPLDLTTGLNRSLFA
jgi:hypothetical protein